MLRVRDYLAVLRLEKVVGSRGACFGVTKPANTCVDRDTSYHPPKVEDKGETRLSLIRDITEILSNYTENRTFPL